MRLAVLGVVLVLAAGCPKPAAHDAGGATVAPVTVKKSTDLTLFLTAELKGSIEPCGCTSDPLGDLARTAFAIREVKKTRQVALLDGGSTLFSELKVEPGKAPQEELKADLLIKTLPDLGLVAAGLGPYDLSEGKDRVRPARMAANVPAKSGLPLDPPRIIDVGGAKIGVFGVVDPDVIDGATDAAEAARGAIAKLRADGAQIIVALAAMRRADAKRLAREAPGADLVLVGEDLPETGVPAAEAVGSSYLISPGNRGQVLARLDLHLDGAGRLTDAIGPELATSEIARLDGAIKDLQGKLATWEQDPNAEAAFVKSSRDELAAMTTRRQELTERPLRAPDQGSWFVLRMLPIKRGLTCAPDIVAAKQALDKSVGEANLKNSTAETPVPLPAGKAGYVGVEECAFCHKAQVEFWNGTHHAQAFATIEKVQKQLDRDCVSCHVTGWLEPTGATLAHNEKLRNVQCEICHGPASLHVDAEGHEKPKSLTLLPAEKMCATRCHTPEHSDTFELHAYLRDVTGKGHGEALRKKLGDGPTGHELRAAALAKAGSDVGASCPR